MRLAITLLNVQLRGFHGRERGSDKRGSDFHQRPREAWDTIGQHFPRVGPPARGMIEKDLLQHGASKAQNCHDINLHGR